MYNCSFYDSFSKDGGSLYLQQNITLLCENCLFERNIAERSGACIFALRNCFINISSAFFLKSNSFNGGALYIHSTFLSISNSQFNENAAIASGGAIWTSSSLLTVCNSNFSLNRGSSGGAILLFQILSAQLSFLYFLNNTADCLDITDSCGIGGALFILNSSASIGLVSSYFLSNNAHWYGAAIGLQTSYYENNYSDSLIFHGNRAKYGTNFGTFFHEAYISSNFTGSTVYIGDYLTIRLIVFDLYKQHVILDRFTLQIDAKINPEGNADFIIYSPKTYYFEILEPRNLEAGDLIYYISLLFSFQNAIPVFPDIGSVFYISLSILVISPNFIIESNNLSFRLKLCRSGYVLVTDTNLFYKCIPCLAGAFVNFTESSVAKCSPCVAGRFSSELSDNCTSCPLGKFSKDLGQADSCSPCSEGTFVSSYGQTACLACVQGRYTFQKGSSFCYDCPNNATTLQSRSSFLDDCVCGFGYFGSPHISCTRCPQIKGIKCESNSSLPFVFAGYWRDSSALPIIQECIPNWSCLESGFNFNTQCSNGYTGRRCGRCIVGKYKRNFSCVDCSNEWVSWIVLLFLFFLFLFAYARSLRSSFNDYSSRPLRSVLISIQTFGVLSRFLDSSSKSYSHALALLMSIFDLSNLNLQFLFSFDCLNTFNFWILYAFKTFSILFVLIFMCFFGFVLSYIKKRSRNTASSGAEFEKSISGFLTILSGLYTFVLSNIFSAFQCYPQEDGTYTLLSDPSLDCYDSIWYDNFAYIFISLSIVFSVPIILFFILYRNRNNFYSSNFYWKYNVLISPYKPQFYYWEVISLLFKTALICLVDLTNGWNKSERSFVLIVYFCVHLYIDIQIDPYRKGNIPILEFRTM